MKRFLGEARKKMRQYWRKRMDSKQKKMSRGASNINKIISFARGDNWRRSKTK